MLLRTFNISSTFCTLTPTYLPFSISCLHFPHFRILTLRFHICTMSNIKSRTSVVTVHSWWVLMNRMFSCTNGTWSRESELNMAVSERLPQSMRIGYTVLLYAVEAKGYVFSELARWAMCLNNALRDYLSARFKLVSSPDPPCHAPSENWNGRRVW